MNKKLLDKYALPIFYVHENIVLTNEKDDDDDVKVIPVNFWYLSVSGSYYQLNVVNPETEQNCILLTKKEFCEFVTKCLT